MQAGSMAVTNIPQVYVLKATNGADFNESDIIVVGTSREAAMRQFDKIIKERWNEQLNEDDRDFYKTMENYDDSWNRSFEVCGLFS